MQYIVLFYSFDFCGEIWPVHVFIRFTHADTHTNKIIYKWSAGLIRYKYTHICSLGSWDMKWFKNNQSQGLLTCQPGAGGWVIDWLFPRPVMSFRHRLVVMVCRLCVVGQVMVSISCVCRADRGRGEMQGHGIHHIKHLSLHLAIQICFDNTVKNGSWEFFI